MTPKPSVSFDDLESALQWAFAAAPSENAARVSRDTGRTFYASIRYDTDDDLPMIDTISRANRRHHIARIKARCRMRSTLLAVPARVTARHVGMLAMTRVPCSCWMCGNPRRYLGERTVQERRAWQAERDGFLDPE